MALGTALQQQQTRKQVNKPLSWGQPQQGVVQQQQQPLAVKTIVTPPSNPPWQQNDRSPLHQQQTNYQTNYQTKQPTSPITYTHQPPIPQVKQPAGTTTVGYTPAGGANMPQVSPLTDIYGHLGDWVQNRWGLGQRLRWLQQMQNMQNYERLMNYAQRFGYQPLTGWQSYIPTPAVTSRPEPYTPPTVQAPQGATDPWHSRAGDVMQSLQNWYSQNPQLGSSWKYRLRALGLNYGNQQHREMIIRMAREAGWQPPWEVQPEPTMQEQYGQTSTYM